MDQYERRLHDLGVDGLTRLLCRRPDVVDGRREIRSLRGLAQQLQTPESVWRALAGENGLTVTVAEALACLGELVHRDELAVLLLEGERVPTTDVDAALEQLDELAVVWSPDPGLWAVGAGLRGVFRAPFGLGPPLHQLLARTSPSDLAAMAAELGLPTSLDPTAGRGRIEAVLREPDRVRALAAGAPREAADVLHTLTWHDTVNGFAVTFPSLWSTAQEVDDETAPAFAAEFQRQQSVVAWLRRHGLLLGPSYDEHMPREVALALRGDSWHPDPSRPPVVTVPVSETAVRADGAAAAAQLLRDADRLLDVLLEAPAALLRRDAGGVGVREVRRLASASGTDQRRVELLLVLLATSGLLDTHSGRVTVTENAPAWRRRDPARRLVELLAHWWEAYSGVTYRPNPCTGKQLPPLTWGPSQHRPQRVRQAVLGVLTDLDPGCGSTGPGGVIEQARWRSPLGMPTEDDLVAIAEAIWWEARALGLIGVDAATPLARALVAGDEQQLLQAAAEALPGLTTTATFGSDLTAHVAGVPSAPLTDLLSACADRESTGTASSWRFSAATVRRWLDTGATGEALLEQLSAIAVAGLPQPLAYLIRDVDRRYGHIRVVELACAVVCDDEALLTELLHTGPLRRLGLRRLAPAVLASREPAAVTTAALRDSGFLPVQEGPAGSVVVTRPPTVVESTAHRARGSSAWAAVSATVLEIRRGLEIGRDDRARRLVHQVLRS
jgi:hypothetical protein